MKAQLGILAIACLLVPANAPAQSPEEQVRARVLSFYQALNAGDAEAWADHNAARYAGNFGRPGLVLTRNAATAVGIQLQFDAGLEYQLGVRQLDVTVFGNTAVATFYTVGPSTFANGTTVDGTFRVTQVWVREGQSWRVAHFHISPLQS